MISLLGYSCKISKTKYDLMHVASEETLDSLIRQKDTTILIFYTGWCGGIKNIDNVYSIYVKKIQLKQADMQVILLAADDDISDSAIISRRELGFLSFRLEAGANAYVNRKRIKATIDGLFPDHQIKELKKIGFPIPIELWVTKNKRVFNEYDLSNTYELSDKLLDVKTIKVEHN